MLNDCSDKRKQIIALIIIIIILLLGWHAGRQIQISLYGGSFAGNPAVYKIADIIKLPFFYVIEYPRILIELASGNMPYYEPQNSKPRQQKPQKQFVKFPGE